MKEGSEERGRSASDKEKTKLRERQRRAITTKIFSGLRKHGGYNLPSRADINDVLRELAREAGWVVEPDGTTYRAKKASSNKNVCSCYCQSKYNGSNAGGECPIGFNQQPSPCSSEVATVTSQLYFQSNSFCRNVAGDEDLSLSLYRDDVAAILANGSHFVGFHGSPSFQMIPHQHSFFFPETRSSNHNTPIASPRGTFHR